MAVVGHKTVPGSIPALFFGEREPTAQEAKLRFYDINPAALEVEGIFDLTNTLANDAKSAQALRDYLDTPR